MLGKYLVKYGNYITNNWLLALVLVTLPLLVSYQVVLHFEQVPFFISIATWLSHVIFALCVLVQGAQATVILLFLSMFTSMIHLLSADIMQLMVFRNMSVFALLWIGAGVYHSYRSWALVLEVYALLGIIFIVLLHLFFPGILEWWVTQLTDGIRLMGTTNSFTKQEIAKLTDFVMAMVPYMTGLDVLMILVSNLVTLLLASMWTVLLTGEKDKLKYSAYSIRVGMVILVVSTVILGLYFMEWAVAYDVAPVLVLCPFFAGVSLWHLVCSNFAKKRGILFSRYLLLGGYILAILLNLWYIFIVAGVIDFFADFRKRYQLVSQV